MNEENPLLPTVLHLAGECQRYGLTVDTNDGKTVLLKVPAEIDDARRSKTFRSLKGDENPLYPALTLSGCWLYGRETSHRRGLEPRKAFVYVGIQGSTVGKRFCATGEPGETGIRRQSLLEMLPRAVEYADAYPAMHKLMADYFSYLSQRCERDLGVKDALQLEPGRIVLLVKSVRADVINYICRNLAQSLRWCGIMIDTPDVNLIGQFQASATPFIISMRPDFDLSRVPEPAGGDERVLCGGRTVGGMSWLAHTFAEHRKVIEREIQPVSTAVGEDAAGGEQ